MTACISFSMIGISNRVIGIHYLILYQFSMVEKSII